MRFRDRREAGKALAERLVEKQRAEELPHPLVLALPRGGLPVADEIARALDAPLDVLVARKVGAPAQPELALGALAGEDPPAYDPSLLGRLGLTEDDMRPVAEREREELRRREEMYREGRPALSVTGRWAIVVDDGVATGATARAALRSLRRSRPTRTTLAVPVAAPDVDEMFAPEEVDEIVCLHRPSSFGAVGFWYHDFPQLTDDEVLEILHADR